MPIAGSVARSPEIHATAAMSPATTDTAFANDRSRPSGVTTSCQAEPGVQEERDAAGATPPRRPAGDRRRGSGRRRPAAAGQSANAASPYRATTVTWSKIIRFGGRRAPGAGACALILRQLSRTPGAPMFDNLSQRLSRVVKQLRGEARLTDANIQDALREVRLALLEADVALPVVKDFVAKIKDKAVGEEVIGSLTPGQALIGVVHRELAALMGGAAAPLDFAVQPPAVVLLAGLQGAGKTTTAAKLAHLLRGQKKKVLLVSADVYRPAAIEQLAVLGAQVGADVFPSAHRRAAGGDRGRPRSTGRSGTITTC